ncbi:unnamed protein product [Nippostrongylus brasiliensis]|uniref:Histone deacetylase HDT1 n=1 Tax=Nippostrongylus brasiliensis TaxID=27835 RepID=A0A0N4XM60_NIPBR|nr:unnamed protein product [Nippostrongylus brasiliensis]VDL67357.1 unnamed protein product [Nippostrongylus brasiliensis]
MNVALFDVSEPESSLSERYSNLSDLLLQSIDKHLPGAEESETESEFSTDASDEESEEDEPRDKKRQ